MVIAVQGVWKWMKESATARLVQSLQQWQAGTGSSLYTSQAVANILVTQAYWNNVIAGDRDDIRAPETRSNLPYVPAILHLCPLVGAWHHLYTHH